jgi:hypothetical protein
MKTKHVATLLTSLLLLSSATLLTTVNAADWPNLPMTQVQLSAVYGTTAYFDSTLSGIPADFDVENGVYPGWCIDRGTDMVQNTPHNVMLYSSLTPPSHPDLDGIDWNAINYILNNKQGGRLDVQNAIWYFTDYTDDSESPDTLAMIAAAEANIETVTGPILAVICLPEDSNTCAQVSIIELERCIPGLSPGFWKHNIGVYLGLKKGAYSSPYEGFDRSTMPTFLESLGIDLEDAFAALSARGGGAIAQARLDMANALNAAAGFQPYMEE